MSEIPRDTIPLYQDRLNMLGELRLSAANAAELMHGYRNFLTMRMTLEQISQGAASNVDFAKWSAQVLAEEKQSRPKLKFPSRLVKIEVV
jgi:hypothetical protein